MPNSSRRKRILDRVLGMASETAWILAMTLLALLLALGAKALWP